MSFLEVENVFKQYSADEDFRIRDFNLSLEKGGIAVLLGASGCGKTTVLKMIAGLEQQDEGHIRIDGELMDAVPPEKRPISMVFQKALLFRNMTVAGNVSFAPRVNHAMPKAEIARRTEEMLDLVGLSGMGSRKATRLSGGQEQRVSLARALMVNPKMLLLDEPLSALDASLRENMQVYIRQLNRETGVTMVFVTHDQREAVAMADRIAVIHDGRVEQVGSPQDFYTRPYTEYVASFFGWTNLIDADSEDGHVRCALGDFCLRDLPADSRKGQLVMRPEAATNIGAGALEGMVRSAVYKGMSTVYDVECRGLLLHVSLSTRYAFHEGDVLKFDLEPGMLWFVPKD